MKTLDNHLRLLYKYHLITSLMLTKHFQSELIDDSNFINSKTSPCSHLY